MALTHMQAVSLPTLLVRALASCADTSLCRLWWRAFAGFARNHLQAGVRLNFLTLSESQQSSFTKFTI